MIFQMNENRVVFLKAVFILNCSIVQKLYYVKEARLSNIELYILTCLQGYLTDRFPLCTLFNSSILNIEYGVPIWLEGPLLFVRIIDDGRGS